MWHTGGMGAHHSLFAGVNLELLQLGGGREIARFVAFDLERKLWPATQRFALCGRAEQRCVIRGSRGHSVLRVGSKALRLAVEMVLPQGQGCRRHPSICVCCSGRAAADGIPQQRPNQGIVKMCLGTKSGAGGAVKLRLCNLETHETRERAPISVALLRPQSCEQRVLGRVHAHGYKIKAIERGGGPNCTQALDLLHRAASLGVWTSHCEEEQLLL